MMAMMVALMVTMAMVTMAMVTVMMVAAVVINWPNPCCHQRFLLTDALRCGGTLVFSEDRC